MKFKTDAATLAKALEPPARVIPARSSVQVLGGFRFQVAGGQVHVTATDLETAIISRFEAEGDVVEGVVVAGPAKRILQAVKTLDGCVEVTVDKDALVLSCGTSKIRFHTYTTDDYPRLPECDTIVAEISRMSFGECYDAVRRVFSRDASRPILCGVLVETDYRTVRMVATDSYRLAVHQQNATGSDTPHSLVVPGSALELVSKHFGKLPSVTVRAGELHVSFTVGAVTIVTRKIPGQFPRWQELRPDTFEGSVKLDRKATLAAAQRINKLQATRAPLRLTVAHGRKQARLECHEQDGVSMSETVLADVTLGHQGAGEMALGANARMFAEALECFDSDTVTLNVINPLRPMLFQNGRPECWHLLMPIRLAG